MGGGGGNFSDPVQIAHREVDWNGVGLVVEVNFTLFLIAILTFFLCGACCNRDFCRRPRREHKGSAKGSGNSGIGSGSGSGSGGGSDYERGHAPSMLSGAAPPGGGKGQVQEAGGRGEMRGSVNDVDDWESLSLKSRMWLFFTATEAQLQDRIGQELSLYLAFQREMILLIGVMAFLALPVIVPVNKFTGSDMYVKEGCTGKGGGGGGGGVGGRQHRWNYRWHYRMTN
jgi:hypothetical protein